jgi:hypothetical protein
MMRFLALPCLAFNLENLKYPEFSRTATYWKKFTSSFKRHKKSFAASHAMMFWTTSLPSIDLENLNTLNSAAPHAMMFLDDFPA